MAASTVSDSDSLTPRLFTPLTLRGLTIPNRLWVSPMCMYSCPLMDGVPTDFHLAHLGQRAVGGAGLVCAEASAVCPEGRISPFDAAIFSDAQVAAWARIAAFITAQGSVPAIQLAHAGRKASAQPPWLGGGVVKPSEPGGWTPLAPSALPFHAGAPVAPTAMTPAAIDTAVEAFAAAARNAHRAGFKVIEIHAAHGYLLHSFMSPLSNSREDEFGGSFENRVRFPLRVVRAVRAAWPADLPLFVRVSSTDWLEGGWTIEDSVQLARLLSAEGVDLVDASSGGTSLAAKVPLQPGYQVEFADRIRREAGVPTAAVGLITTAEQAEAVLAEGKADAVFMGRELLREPYFPLKAAKALGFEMRYPNQYARGRV